VRLWIEIVVSGFITGGIYALVAMGLNLQYGLMRILNVSHGEFLMLGAYLVYWAHLVTHLSPFVFLPPLLVGLFGVGLVVHRLCFRRLAETTPEVEAFEARSLLVGFGLMFVVQNVALLVWGADLRGYQYLSNTVSIAGVGFTANRLVAFVGALLIGLGLIALLRATLLGRAVRAMMQSPTGALLVGIDVRRLHPAVFGVGLALAGAAGALLSMVFEISPSMGEPYTVTALIVIALGGFGSVTGSLLGGLLLGVVEAIGMHLTSPSLKMVLSYGVFMLVLITRPNGLFAR
jgi:branched-chain amino acid transport system permease protein